MAGVRKHIVQSGDTLSAIAKQLGAPVSQLTGFSSGNADLIRPGEVISVKQPSNDQATSRASSIRTELGGTERPTTGAGDGTPNGRGQASLDDGETSGGFDVETLRSNVNDAKAKRDEAYKKLDGFRTSRYDELVSDRALNDRKDEIASLDDQIAEARRVRDESVNKIRSNPGASAATLTGEVARATDKLNADINNLISQRNSVAGEYNTELSEIERLVENEAKDIEASFGFFDNSVTEAEDLYNAYQKAIIDELTKQDDRAYDEQNDLRDFEQALQLARMRQSSSGGGSSGSGLTPYQTFQATQSLKKTNQKNIAASQELKRQTDIINNTWNRLASGQAKDLNATSQAIIVTFNKILDPTSVVRESEYDRTGQGQALLSNIQGKIAAISQGGPGLTRASLQELVNLGNTYAKNAESYIQESNRRAEEEARFFGINPDFVTSTQIPNQMDSTPTGNTYTVETPAIMNTEENKGGLVNWFKGLFK